MELSKEQVNGLMFEKVRVLKKTTEKVLEYFLSQRLSNRDKMYSDSFRATKALCTKNNNLFSCGAPIATFRKVEAIKKNVLYIRNDDLLTSSMASHIEKLRGYLEKNFYLFPEVTGSILTDNLSLFFNKGEGIR